MMFRVRTKWILVAGLAAAALAVLVLGIERGSAPTLVLFAGRFHPTIVHFPIAFLILGASIEILAPSWRQAARVQPAVPFILGLGAFSALAAAVLGYLLSLGGGYEAGLLSLHMWLGFIVFALSVGLAAVSIMKTSRGRIYRGALAVLLVLIVVTGHFGGSLARGSDYLTYYLPTPVKQLTGLGRISSAGLIADVDSALVYADLVQPILDRRCVKCHGASKAKGDLRLDTRGGLEEGGRNGPAYVPGNPGRSEIVRRITLSPFDEDAMPPRGEPPLDVGETEVIRWWVYHQASFEMRIADVPEMPSAVDTYVKRVAAPQAPRRSGIFALEVPDADSTAIAALRRKGLVISRLDPDAPFLEVSAANVRDGFTDSDFEALRPIARQISRLDVAATQITSRASAVLPEMPHLTHLHLENTDVDGAILEGLRGLEYLEYLNLYGTALNDQDLEHVSEMNSLSSLYLWQTGISADRAAALRRANPGLYVNVGSNLTLADSAIVR